ncbi:hypothetical protein [Vibrio hippocampi]|uniref:CBM-cenC domain-containing protein n=1 Tax=Vibrio hippocampi TaxID=654686 RepID=A0ABN8DNC0_9VIBR|nr:hypothetical protein [Vibrio hippocampi]CAH0530401.1 hypothetical protein VHP8226_04044 [Vibrio hippocampi]
MKKKYSIAAMVAAPLMLNSYAFASASADWLDEVDHHIDSVRWERNFSVDNNVNVDNDSDPASRTINNGLRPDLDVEGMWWTGWEDIVGTTELYEAQTCATLMARSTPTLMLKDDLAEDCVEVVFYESFDTERGTGFQPISSKKTTPTVAIPYGSLKKFNSYGSGPMLLKYNSIWAQAGADLQGYVLSLSTPYGSARVDTKGGIPLAAGNYKLAFKVKASTHSALAKFAGVSTHISGDYIDIRQNDYVQAFWNNTHWSTVIIPFSLVGEDEVRLSFEDIFNGVQNRGSIIDDIVVYKLDGTIQ